MISQFMNNGSLRAMNLDKDPRIVNVWQANLEEEVEHLSELISTYKVIAIVGPFHLGYGIPGNTLQAAGKADSSSKTETSTPE